MARIRAASIAVFAWLTAGVALAQGSAEPDGTILSGPVAQAIDEYLTRCVPFGFSGSVLAVKGGTVILSRGYGVADRATGAVCAPSTIYDFGHVAQPLTACAVLVLEQQRKLKTKDTLDVYFGDVPPDKKKLQLHHLLSHTSGLPRTGSSVNAKIATREELIQTALRAPLRDPPGTEFSAADANYALLAAIVEMVTKKPFEEALAELVLQPAGLASAGFRQGTGMDAARVARSLARPEEPVPEGTKVTRLPDEKPSDDELASQGWYSWGLRGAGGILGTASDLWSFEQALRGEALLTKDSKKKLFTPGLASCAYGWLVLKGKPPSIEARGTTTNGFAARCVRFPEDGSYLVLLANAAGALGSIDEDVRALLFGGRVALPPEARSQPLESLAARQGEYEGTDGALWRVSPSGTTLLLEARTPPAFELHAGKLGGDQKRIVKLSTTIVAGLASSDFGQLNELDEETSRLRGVESWWRGLVDHHGSLRGSRVLGLIQDTAELNHVVALLEFERGEEQLDLTWGDEDIIGLGTGPPFASRLRLVPSGEESFLAYDLVRRKQLAVARFAADGTLELELPGGKMAAKRR